MLNRSAFVVGYTPAFVGLLRKSGVSDEAIRGHGGTAGKCIYLIPACHYPEEIDEVVEDMFEEIVQREFASWHLDERLWPDPADYGVFARLFTVEGFSFVCDLGRAAIEEEAS